MAKGFKHGAGGGTSLNFKVVGGTSAPSNSKANTIWVNTDKEITSWHFGAEEPNVYELQNEIRTDNGQVDPRSHFAPHKLTEGNIINFVVPYTSTESMEWLAIVDTYDNSQRYCIRNADHTLLTTWEKGAKVSVKISNDETAFDVHKFRTAYIVSYGSYYHEEGTVWISTDTFSTAPFNALKKNGIMVYPLSAKQYVSGAWVYKTAKNYQGGKWVDLWNGSLYDSGNEYTEITGGWVAVGKAMGYWATGVGTPVLTKNSDNMVFSVSISGNGAMFYTKNKINLANYKTLHLECTLNTPSAVGYEHRHNLNIWTSIGTYYTDNRAATTDLHGTGDATRSIDVSNLNDSYYIGFASYTEETVVVKKLWLE